MSILPRIVRVLWLLWIVFLYFLLLPAVCRPAGAFVGAIYDNMRLLAGYYDRQRALPPELSFYSEFPEKAVIHSDNIYKPAVVRGDGREFVASCRVSLGLGDWVWQAKPSPLLIFPENLEKDDRAIMMFFDPTSAKQRAVFKKDGKFVVDEIPVAEAKKVILENRLPVYRLQIQGPRWGGMIFHVAVFIITVCLFLPVGKVPVSRRWMRGVVICGAAIPLCLMLFCVNGYSSVMILLGMAVLACGLAEIAYSSPKPPENGAANADRD